MVTGTVLAVSLAVLGAAAWRVVGEWWENRAAGRRTDGWWDG